jgi:acyl-CoA synthetase (AMP-forming)/AMP-acid ligase II
MRATCARADLPGFTQRVLSVAEADPTKPAFIFLTDRGDEAGRLSFRELVERSQALAHELLRRARPADRALLVTEPSLDFAVGFLGCLFAGIYPVPAYPPHPGRPADGLATLERIAADCQPALLITTPLVSAGLRLLAQGRPTPLVDVPWLTVDEVDPSPGPTLVPDGHGPAFLQYTSGSTTAPRGVVITHDNLNHYFAAFYHANGGIDRPLTAVSWLPQYHDMGLIGNQLTTAYGGNTCVLMSPLTFLKQPVRWLEAITRYRAGFSGGPPFAYELCVTRITPGQIAALDLTSWRVANVGAEPIRGQILSRFCDTFAPAGFDRRAIFPCYGLAEATVWVSGVSEGDGFAVHTFDRATLAEGRAQRVGDGYELVSCGVPISDHRVLVMPPGEWRELPPLAVGELVVSGPCVADGYWNDPGETEAVFATGPGGPRVRTGDLGFIDPSGEIFITGRLKDVLSIRGRQVYPQDIERTAELFSPALRPGYGAVFPVPVDEEEQVVLVQECLPLDEHPGAFLQRLRGAIVAAHDVGVRDVVLIERGTLPKTSSGKVRRRFARQMFEEGRLAVVHRLSQGA